MTKRMKKTGLVAVALAASAVLLGAPGQAQTANAYGPSNTHNAQIFGNGDAQFHQVSRLRRHKGFSRNRGFSHNRGFHNGRSFGNNNLLLKKKYLGTRLHGLNRNHFGNVNRLNAYGQTLHHSDQLQRQALHSCSVQLREDAFSLGYRGARIADPVVDQVDKEKFVVHGDAKLFTGYRLNSQAYTCTVYDGHVVDAAKPAKF